MLKAATILSSLLVIGWTALAFGDVTEKVVDIATRPGVTQRIHDSQRHERILGATLQLERIKIPTLVVHHVDDGCAHCPYSQISRVMDKLTAAPKKKLLPVKGGVSEGDPCEARAYHGFNGIEAEVVKKSVAWMLEK